MSIKDIIGVVLSVIGLWLTSGGIVGEKRLRNFEQWLRNHIYGTQGFMRISYRRVFGWFERLIGLYPIVYGIFGIIVLLVVIYGIVYFYNWNNQIDKSKDMVEWFILTLQYFCALYVALLYFSGIYLIVFVVISLPLVLTIIALIILLIVWLVLLPYVIMDLAAIRYRLESSLILFGLAIGTVGILVLEMK